MDKTAFSSLTVYDPLRVLLKVYTVEPILDGKNITPKKTGRTIWTVNRICAHFYSGHFPSRIGPLAILERALYVACP